MQGIGGIDIAGQQALGAEAADQGTQQQEAPGQEVIPGRFITLDQGGQTSSPYGDGGNNPGFGTSKDRNVAEPGIIRGEVKKAQHQARIFNHLKCDVQPGQLLACI